MPDPKPNLVDKVVGYFSPRAGMERRAWRTMEASYKGGVPTRTSETWGMDQTTRFGTTLERYQLMNARDRANQAYRNNLVAKTLIQTETDNVIGDGLNYMPTTKSAAWNREAKDKYYEWLKNISVRGSDVLTGCEVERLLWSQSRVAGDVGWILVSQGPESRIQVIESHRISSPYGDAADGSITDGIKFDLTGAPKTFYVKSASEVGKWFEVPARDFVFFAHHSNPSQARGESCFITIFDLLAHLDRYVDGVSLAAWMATVFGLVFKEASAAKQFAGLSTLAANSQGQQQRAITLEGGQVKYMAPEGEVVQVDAKQPMQQTPQFIQQMLRLLGMPFDMPLEVFARDMSSSNFASARIGLLPFYRACRIKAARFGARWSRTIQWWLSRENLRARDDPKRWKTAFPEDFWSHELRCNSWAYTDPVSDVQSQQLQVDAKFKSPQMVIEEQGGDVSETLRQLEEWQKLTASLPQTHSTMSRDPQADPNTASQPAKPPAKPDQGNPADANA